MPDAERCQRVEDRVDDDGYGGDGAPFAGPFDA